MRRTFLTALSTVAAAVALSVGAVSTAGSAGAVPGAHGQRVCADANGPDEARCHALKLVDANGNSVNPDATSPPASGKTPVQIRDAYKLPASGGGTVAIVDAYGYPNAERDLGVYRAQFGMSPCTRANGCLRIIDQNGGTNPPRFDVGWATEQALDLDAVSATCPGCKIVLVQASSASFVNLGQAVNTAAGQPGVVAISNSYGSNGDASDSNYGTYYNHAGIAVTASTGDNGYQGGSYPASSTYTVAVGGTSLSAASNTRGWNETVWSGAGSGCSTYNVKPTWQGSYTQCSKRAMADVSAVADPQTGLSVYAPTNRNSSSWAQYGGTSLSSPIIAAVYALGGVAPGSYPVSKTYATTGSLFDVTSGSNGSCPTPVWCRAGAGWDGPTGLGTPSGVSAF